MKDLLEYMGGFNEDVSKWNTGKVTTVYGMSNGARSFNLRLKWDLKDGVGLTDVVKGTNGATSRENI